jgi:hypothetical protein
MSDTHTVTATLRPGDPPPFWEGPWHPEGKLEGAVMVRPRGAADRGSSGQSITSTVPAAAPPAAVEPVIATAAPMVAPELPIAPSASPTADAVATPVEDPTTAAAAAQTPAENHAPTAESTAPRAAESTAPQAAESTAAPASVPAVPAPGAVINLGPAPEAPATVAAPPPPAPPAPAPPARAGGLSLAAQGTLAAAQGLPTQANPAASDALRTKAKELQAAGQLGPALQALGEALKHSPGEPATYAQMGQALLAGRAWEDAAHHFLIAYMLAPREPAYGRMTLNAAFVLGYVGWAFQIAQALYKAAPAPDLAEMGRQAQGWLQARPAAVTALCPACRATSILPAPGPCPKCGANPMGAPANATGFAGLKLLQQGGPSGRLFAGANCIACKQDTILVIAKGGPSCQACQQPSVAPM